MFESAVGGCSQLPVTALEFATDTILLAANGGSLSVYNCVSRLRIGHELVFPYGPRIYGIHVVQKQALIPEAEKRWLVLVHGSKSWATLRVALNYGSTEATITIESRHEAYDWIKASHWVYGESASMDECDPLVALALAHNDVIVCERLNGAVIHQVRCEERCILYGAAFYGRMVDELVVAAGTVFNQILVWKVSPKEGPQITHRLRGHQGVVFGACFSSNGRKIASVSDDRSVIIWDLCEHANNITQLFGHQARVWTCLFLDAQIPLLVSASEDGTCRVWATAKEIAIDSWRQCKKNAWTLAANPSQTIVASGGADGSIRLSDLSLGKRVEQPEILSTIALPPKGIYIHSPLNSEPHNEHIRCFVLTGKQSELLVTNSGYILDRGDDDRWSTWYSSDELKGYSVTACSWPSVELVAVGMRNGTVLLLAPQYFLARKEQYPLYMTAKLHLTSVHRIFIISKDGAFDLLTVGSEDSNIIWSEVKLTDTGYAWVVKAAFVMPLGSGPITSASIDQDRGWAAVGTANGGLYLFGLEAEGAYSGCLTTDFSYTLKDSPHQIPLIEPSIIWAKAHSKYTISTIAFMPDSTSISADEYPRKCIVLTGGRDGLVQRFSVKVRRNTNPTSEFAVSNIDAKPVQNRIGRVSCDLAVIATRARSDRLTRGWVEQLMWLNCRLVAVVFQGKRLVAMDLGTGDSIEHATVLFSMVCAGGSKQWQMLASSGGTRIGVIMRSQLKTHEFAEIPCNIDLAKGGLVPGGSSVEIRAVACIESTDIYSSVIATGGEDGYLRLCRPPRSDLKETGLIPLFEARRHTSAIRCICISGLYLFTGGGGCELRCWRYYRDGEFELSDYAVAPSLGDSRVMNIIVLHEDESIGIVIAAAYSDASIRLWRLDSLNRQLVCVAQDVNSTNRHCVLSLGSFSHNNSVNGVHRATKYVVSGSTSGQLAFWDVTQFLEPNIDLKIKRDLGPPILLQENVHQSGVNTIAISSHHDTCSVSIATGGDDGSVAIWEYSAALSDPLSTKLKLVARRTDAHASAVQAVAFLDGRQWVCSLGTDQRLAIWSVNNGHLDLAHMVCSQVADPSAMTILDSKYRSAVIVGIGVEFINFQ